jgi:hypothetical protein
MRAEDLGAAGRLEAGETLEPRQTATGSLTAMGAAHFCGGCIGRMI